MDLEGVDGEGQINYVIAISKWAGAGVVSRLIKQEPVNEMVEPPPRRWRSGVDQLTDSQQYLEDICSVISELAVARGLLSAHWLQIRLELTISGHGVGVDRPCDLTGLEHWGGLGSPWEIRAPSMPAHRCWEVAAVQ